MCVLCIMMVQNGYRKVIILLEHTVIKKSPLKRHRIKFGMPHKTVMAPIGVTQQRENTVFLPVTLSRILLVQKQIAQDNGLFRKLIFQRM